MGEYFIDKRDGIRHQSQQPTKPKPTPQTPLRTMAQGKQAVREATTAEVPPPPDTLGQAVQWKKDHGML